ncbi:MAG: HU domain-containing protein [Bacteroidia bacterium]
MENLGKYISELLSEHDCVILPGFGGFVARPVSAQFSKAGNMLLPPGKSLIFNKNLTNNDGLLAGFVMEKESLTYKDAITKIDRLIFECRKSLENGKRLELENTGLLYYNAENNLLFEPSLSKTHEINSFGLVAVNAVKLVKEESVKTKEKQLIYRETENTKVSGNRTLMRISVAVSSVLLFAFLLLLSSKQLPINHAIASLNPFSSKENNYKENNYNLGKLLSEADKKLADEVKISSSVKLSETSAKVFTVRTDTVNADKTSVIKHTVVSGNNSFSGTFQIVVGCFAIEKNAHKLIRQLQSQNIDAGISGQNARGLYIVSVAGFSSENLARAKLNQVKQSVPNAWIMVR